MPNTATLNAFRSYFPSLPQIGAVEAPLMDDEIVSIYNNLLLNQNSVNDSLASMLADSPLYAEKFFEKYANPAFQKKLTVESLEYYRFNDKFHNSAEINDLTQTEKLNSIVLHANEFTTYNELDYYVMLFNAETGYLIPSNCYRTYHKMGGVKLLINEVNEINGETIVTDGSELHLVIMRRMLNQEIKYHAKVFDGGSMHTTFEYVIQNATATVGPLTDNKDFKVSFSYKPSTYWMDGYLRDGYDYHIDINRETDTIRVNIDFQPSSFVTFIPPITTFYVMHGATFIDLEFYYDSSECSSLIHDTIPKDNSALDETSIPNKLSASTVFALKTKQTDSMPSIPLPQLMGSNAESLMLFSNGLKMIPYEDYSFDVYGRITLSEKFFLGKPNIHFRMISNGNFAESSFYTYFETVPLIENVPIIDFQKTVSHVIRHSSFMFNNRRFVSEFMSRESGTQIVTNSIAYIPSLGSLKSCEIFSIFLNDSITTDLIQRISETKPLIEGYLERVGLNNLNWVDYIQASGINAYLPSEKYDTDIDFTSPTNIYSISTYISNNFTTNVLGTELNSAPVITSIKTLPSPQITPATWSFNGNLPFAGGTITPEIMEVMSFDSNRDRSPCSPIIIDLELSY